MEKFAKYDEAVEDHGYPGGWHPSKRRAIEEPNEVDRILPDLGPNAQKYLEHVSSESYQKIVQRLAHYLHIDVDQLQQQYPSASSYMALILGALREVQQLEQNHKEHLEAMALHTVLDLPEFEMIKEMYEDGTLEFDIALDTPDLARSIGKQDAADQLEQDELSPMEDATLELSEEMQDEADLKREYANFITQGNAVSKLYLFNAVTPELQQIDPTLPEKYGILSAVIQVMYYAMPKMGLSQAMAQQAAMGSEEIDRNNNIIKARGTTFPYLIHEIVKGIWEYLSVGDESTDQLSGETLDDEDMQFMAGPEMYRHLIQLVPDDRINLFPLIYKLLLAEPKERITAIMHGGNQARVIMNELVERAQHLRDEYNQEDDEPYNDGYDDDGGNDDFYA